MKKEMDGSSIIFIVAMEKCVVAHCKFCTFKAKNGKQCANWWNTGFFCRFFSVKYCVKLVTICDFNAEIVQNMANLMKLIAEVLADNHC